MFVSSHVVNVRSDEARADDPSSSSSSGRIENHEEEEEGVVEDGPSVVGNEEGIQNRADDENDEDDDNSSDDDDDEEEEDPQDPNQLRFDEWQFAGTLQSIFETMAEHDDDDGGGGGGLDMTSMTDYMIAQMAIVYLESSNPHADAVQSALGLQTFREKYGIRDTLTEGLSALQDLVELVPGWFLDFSFHPDNDDADGGGGGGGGGRYCLVVDLSKFDLRELGQSEIKFNKWMVAHYYLRQAINCDLQTIRRGCLFVLDCGDVTLSFKNDFQIGKEIDQQFLIYPLKPTFRFYNVGTFFHTVFCAVKKVTPERIKNKFDFVTNQRSDTPLREIFSIPNLEAANQRTIKALQDALKKRYENERVFTL